MNEGENGTSFIGQERKAVLAVCSTSLFAVSVFVQNFGAKLQESKSLLALRTILVLCHNPRLGKLSNEFQMRIVNTSPTLGQPKIGGKV